MSTKRHTSWLSWVIAAAFVIVIVFGWIAFNNITQVRRAESLIARSHQVREMTRQLVTIIRTLEKKERDFVLTGNASNLEKYESSLEDIDTTFGNLREIKQGDRKQLERLENLEALYQKKLAAMEHAIEVHTEFLKDHPVERRIESEAMQGLLNGQGKSEMDDIQRVVGEILAAEATTLLQRTSESESRASRAKNLIIAGNLLTLILLTTSGLVAWLDRRHRERALTQLTEKQAELADIFNTTPDGIITFDDQFRIRLINPAAELIFLCEADHAAQQMLTQFFPVRVRESMTADFQRFIDADDLTQTFENGIALRTDGKEFPCKGTLLKSRNPENRTCTLLLRDLSDERATADRIRQQNEILEQVAEAIFVCDANDRITFWNRGAEILFGFRSSEAMGNNVIQLLYRDHPETWNSGLRDLADSGVFASEFPMANRFGQSIWIEQRRSIVRNPNHEPIAQMVISTDITSRRNREEGERRAQRIESIGTLTGGIAHDINNLLTPILMNAKLIKLGRGDTEKLADNIVLGAQRGGEMIRRLLTFAGGEHSQHQPVDVAAIIHETADILGHTFPKSIDIEVVCSQHLHPVVGDPTELSQVLLNLAINSRDAMPDGGQLSIRATNFDVDSGRAQRSRNLEVGPHVMITVADHGTGIPLEIIDKIFDPYFTTKEQGKGTGLGLATSLGIVRQHHGDMSVYSEPGQGTSFSILIPAAKLVTTQISVPENIRELRGQGQRILMVDDEPSILEAARTTLEANGYRVHMVTSGEAALTALTGTEGATDLVILDMMMPGIGGIETCKRARAFDARIPIVASSGLRRPQPADSQALIDFDVFLPKPYTDIQLLTAVAKGLRKHRPPDTPQISIR